VRALVTGAAGFVGSTLVDRLLGEGHEVAGLDDFSTGQRFFLDPALADPRFSLHEGDVLDSGAVARAMEGAEVVFHLAANADVRNGPLHPRRDLEQNAVGTATVLEAMQAAGTRRIVLASTGSVYGEPHLFPTPEDAPFPVQTSFYAASKLAAEGLVAAHAAAYGVRGVVCRFVSILGERYTHGHVIDFVRRLSLRPETLEVLGDGSQRKSYVHVDDAVGAMLAALERSRGPFDLFNVGTDETCRVADSVRWICEDLGVAPRIEFGTGPRGWVGDSPVIHLDCRRLRALGWQPTVGIREAIRRTVRYLEAEGARITRR
jgi:UDP-glucose 4-epimerase